MKFWTLYFKYEKIVIQESYIFIEKLCVWSFFFINIYIVLDFVLNLIFIVGND